VDLKNFDNANHICNNVGEFLSFDNGTISSILVLTPIEDFDALMSSLSFP